MNLAQRRAPWLRIAVGLLLFLGLLLLAQQFGDWLRGEITGQLWPRHLRMATWLLLAALLGYTLLMALPFMPGIEIGLALMLVLGREGVVLVYLCTVLALMLSFLAGRLLALQRLTALLDWLHLQRASELLRRFVAVPAPARLDWLRQRLPGRLGRLTLHHRYLLVALLLNLPGNALIGGGGGIGLLAGMSGLYTPWKFLLLVALAVSPVPIFLLISGTQ